MPPTEHPQARHRTPPNVVYAFAELPRAVFEMLSLLPAHALVSRAPRGDGHPVITLPGYRANDSSMHIMRRYLERWGYDPHPWGLGTNFGVGNDRVDYEKRFVETLESIVDKRGEAATLIGWSQGGVIARQAAKARPELVRHVLTMGSPIADTPEATTIWRIFRRTSPQEITPELLDILRKISTPVQDVRCTCIYSQTDGIVAPYLAQDWVSPVAENIRLYTSHFGMAVNPLVLLVIADRLAQTEDDWRPFNKNILERLLLN
jgi:pimeloyl-ACP methyl ester carboxylesterase